MLFFGLRGEFEVWELTIFQPSRRAEDGLSATRVGLFGSRAEASRAIESIAAYAFAGAEAAGGGVAHDAE